MTCGLQVNLCYADSWYFTTCILLFLTEFFYGEVFKVGLTFVTFQLSDCGDELDLVNASGSMMETSDNFAKKEKKSGSFVQ